MKEMGSPSGFRCCVSGESAACTCDHVRVDIDELEVRCAESVEDDLAADSSPAAELEHPSTFDTAAEPLEERRHRVSLYERTRRAIQAELAKLVELHLPSSNAAPVAPRVPDSSSFSPPISPFRGETVCEPQSRAPGALRKPHEVDS